MGYQLITYLYSTPTPKIKPFSKNPANYHVFKPFINGVSLEILRKMTKV